MIEADLVVTHAQGVSVGAAIAQAVAVLAGPGPDQVWWLHARSANPRQAVMGQHHGFGIAWAARQTDLAISTARGLGQLGLAGHGATLWEVRKSIT